MNQWRYLRDIQKFAEQWDPSPGIEARIKTLCRMRAETCGKLRAMEAEVELSHTKAMQGVVEEDTTLPE